MNLLPGYFNNTVRRKYPSLRIKQVQKSADHGQSNGFGFVLIVSVPVFAQEVNEKQWQADPAYYTVIIGRSSYGTPLTATIKLAGAVSLSDDK